VTVRKMNVINEIPCGCGTLSTTAVRMWHPVSHRACAEFIAGRIREYLEVLVSSVSNGSNPLERAWDRVGTGPEPLQQALPHDNLDRCNWASFTTKNPEF